MKQYTTIYAIVISMISIFVPAWGMEQMKQDDFSKSRIVFSETYGSTEEQPIIQQNVADPLTQSSLGQSSLMLSIPTLEHQKTQPIITKEIIDYDAKEAMEKKAAREAATRADISSVPLKKISHDTICKNLQMSIPHIGIMDAKQQFYIDNMQLSLKKLPRSIVTQNISTKLKRLQKLSTADNQKPQKIHFIASEIGYLTKLLCNNNNVDPIIQEIHIDKKLSPASKIKILTTLLNMIPREKVESLLSRASINREIHKQKVLKDLIILKEEATKLLAENKGLPFEKLLNYKELLTQYITALETSNAENKEEKIAKAKETQQAVGQRIYEITEAQTKAYRGKLSKEELIMADGKSIDNGIEDGYVTAFVVSNIYTGKTDLRTWNLNIANMEKFINTNIGLTKSIFSFRNDTIVEEALPLILQANSDLIATIHEVQEIINTLPNINPNTPSLISEKIQKFNELIQNMNKLKKVEMPQSLKNPPSSLPIEMLKDLLLQMLNFVKENIITTAAKGITDLNKQIIEITEKQSSIATSKPLLLQYTQCLDNIKHPQDVIYLIEYQKNRNEEIKKEINTKRDEIIKKITERMDFLNKAEDTIALFEKPLETEQKLEDLALAKESLQKLLPEIGDENSDLYKRAANNLELANLQEQTIVAKSERNQAETKIIPLKKEIKKLENELKSEENKLLLLGKLKEIDTKLKELKIPNKGDDFAIDYFTTIATNINALKQLQKNNNENAIILKLLELYDIRLQNDGKQFIETMKTSSHSVNTLLQLIENYLPLHNADLKYYREQMLTIITDKSAKAKTETINGLRNGSIELDAIQKDQIKNSMTAKDYQEVLNVAIELQKEQEARERKEQAIDQAEKNKKKQSIQFFEEYKARQKIEEKVKEKLGLKSEAAPTAKQITTQTQQQPPQKLEQAQTLIQQATSAITSWLNWLFGYKKTN